MRELIIATKNAKKLHELKKYLKGVKAKVLSLENLKKTPRIREDQDTFKKNVIKKAFTVSRFTGGLVLADDSGLVVKALGGRPGVKSARFAGPGKSDHANNLKLLKSLEGLPLRKRKARFVCAVAIADKGKIIKVIENDCKGVIAYSIRGRHGFGYDPVFLIPKYKKTFGELGPRVKDKMSHRAKALKMAHEFLKNYV